MCKDLKLDYDKKNNGSLRLRDNYNNAEWDMSDYNPKRTLARKQFIADFMTVYSGTVFKDFVTEYIGVAASEICWNQMEFEDEGDDLLMPTTETFEYWIKGFKKYQLWNNDSHDKRFYDLSTEEGWDEFTPNLQINFEKDNTFTIAYTNSDGDWIYIIGKGDMDKKTFNWEIEQV